MIRGIIFAVVIAAIIVAANSIFIVSEGEQAIVRRFGDPMGDVRYAGINFKFPFIDDVVRFEKRILKWDGDPNQITTREMKYIWVDATARWRISDPLEFLKSVGTITGARNKLDDVVDSVVRDAVSGNYLVDLVRGPTFTPPEDESFLLEEDIADAGKTTREEIIDEAFEQAKVGVPEYGIELIDLQIKRLNYIEEVQEYVYQRMISDRNKVAAEYRSEGEGRKAEILGEMERDLMEIRSKAYRESTEIKGRADAEAAEIYAEAYGKDPEFYAFYRTMESMEKTIAGNSNLVISTDSEFYSYLKNSK